MLAAIAAAYAGVSIALNLHVGLFYDEGVYLSQFAHGVPAAGFSAGRAWGVPLLVAPVDVFTASLIPIRVYLGITAGLGLFLAYLPWLKLRPGGVVPLAAFCFASLWLALFYGGTALPSLYAAFGAVAAVGLFALALRDRGGLALVGLAASFAFLSLMRPTDSVWIALPLVAALVVVRDWRRLAPLVAIAVGLAIGWGEWLIEAFIRFDGPFSRLHDAQAASATNSGVHVIFGNQLRALDGPLICSTSSDCGHYPPAGIAFFAGALIMAGVGIYATRRVPAGRHLGLAGLAAAVIGGSYAFFLVSLTVPRYLLPFYALLSLPAAEGLAYVARRRHGSIVMWRAGTAAAVIAAYVVVQARYLDPELDAAKAQRALYEPLAQAATRQLRLHSPCLVWATQGTQIAYAARCEAGTLGEFQSPQPPPDLLAARDAGKSVAVVAQRASLPWHELRDWHRVRLRGIPAREHWFAFAPPG